MIRIGIDVGGTNTDAVLMRDTTVLHEVKVFTTEDVLGGVMTALRRLLDESGTGVRDVGVVMIGTTHFTNAIIQRRNLARTAAVRLGLPATACLPPMVDWPEDLRQAIGNHWFLAHGGHEFDGRVISNLDADELRGIGHRIRSLGIDAIAVTSVFSPVTDGFERTAAEILAEAVPSAHVTLSSEIGRIGLLERENAAIMNACLRHLSSEVMAAFRFALTEIGLACPFYLTQNDGTLMNVAFAERFPVLTITSGPTNSMRGAAFLSGVKDALVIDIGGTTSDVGALHHGFPRCTSVTVKVGGVRTNFRVPDILSIGLGGGSVVSEDNVIKIGPRSVGYRLAREARIFGGSMLTASDIAVAAGIAELGDPAKVRTLDRTFVEDTMAAIANMLALAVERMRLSPTPLPVIVVGGGSILVGSAIGSFEAVKPPHFAVANAVGAAIAQVSGEVDRIYTLGQASRAEALGDAKARAIEFAVAAGALSESVEVVDFEDVPLAYLPGNAIRIRVKAVGDLRV